MPTPDDQHAAFRAERLAALGAPDGWLNLTDRVEIVGPGPHAVGTAAGNDLVLTAGPARLGHLRLTQGGAELTTPDGVVHGFAPAPGGFPQAHVPPLLLEIHTVDGQPALRVRDTALRRDVNIPCYPFDPAWIIDAEWQALTAPEQLTIGQRGGGAANVTATHRAIFEHAGQRVSLTPTHWKDGKPMFVLRDATAGQDTYGAARFLIGAVSGDRVRLDFNRAINPPCAFTDFAICPLPPPGNVLPFRIEAGERRPEP